MKFFWKTTVFKPLLILTISVLLFHEGIPHQVNNNPFIREEILDVDQGETYSLVWEVDWTQRRVVFNVTVRSTGWVAFGLSNNARVSESGADLVVGGVEAGMDGVPYFSDRHVTAQGNSTRSGSSVGGNFISASSSEIPQNYILHRAWESRTHTFLSFSRRFDTCDENWDYNPIGLNKITLLWAYGHDGDDKVEDAFGNNVMRTHRYGFYHTHLLDPEYAPKIVRSGGIEGNPTIVTENSNEAIPKDTRAWSVRRTFNIPSNETSYICSIHKAPRLSRKHHFIGFEVHFPNEESKLRTHHMLLYRCQAPIGFTARQIFEPHLGNPGEACYIFRNGFTDDIELPIRFCTEIYSEWSIGARAFFMPNHIGIPFGESENEYYMVQMHYDNPEQREGVTVDTRLDFFYTSQLRTNDGGVLSVAHDLPSLPESLLIPPNERGHRHFAHCSPECTRRIYPKEGIKVVALTLHQHNAGVGVRVRHFRGDRELPWILYDDNFDNLVQPFRHLKEEVRIMPGDQLTVDCSLTTNGSTVVGGYSTRQEMCSTYLLYYNRVASGYNYCWSGIQSQEARRKFLGVQNASWIQEELEWVVNSPDHLSGLKISEVSDYNVNWTPSLRNELRRFHETSMHIGHCLKAVNTLESVPSEPIGEPPMGPTETEDDFVGPVGYPFNAQPYQPEKTVCHNFRNFI